MLHDSVDFKRTISLKDIYFYLLQKKKGKKRIIILFRTKEIEI